MEPEAAARGEGGGVRAGGEAGLLDDQLTVLEEQRNTVSAYSPSVANVCELNS